MSASSRRLARIIVPAIVLGGLIGAGVGLDLYPKAVGVGAAVVLAIAVGWQVAKGRTPPAP